MFTSLWGCIYLLLIHYHRTSYSETVLDKTNNSPLVNRPKMEEVRLKIGAETTLKCNHRHLAKDKIYWQFKHCSLDVLSCSSDDDRNWMELKYNRGKKLFELKNSTEQNTGFYQCLNENGVIKTFAVEIVSELHQGPSPKVLSVVPTNLAVQLNSRFVITCKTSSVVYPEIRWVKECNGGKCDIRENGLCYCSITFSNNSTYPIRNNIYLSKLNIQHARSVDGGLYVCLVITVYGKDYKSVTINVLGSSNFEEIHKSFSLLFLIPLALVLIPIVVWLCYFKRKKKDVRNIRLSQDQQKQLINPVVKVDLLVERNEIV